MHVQKEAKGDENKLMLILPQSIQVNQYVALRLALRRLVHHFLLDFVEKGVVWGY